MEMIASFKHARETKAVGSWVSGETRKSRLSSFNHFLISNTLENNIYDTCMIFWTWSGYQAPSGKGSLNIFHDNWHCWGSTGCLLWRPSDCRTKTNPLISSHPSFTNKVKRRVQELLFISGQFKLGEEERVYRLEVTLALCQLPGACDVDNMLFEEVSRMHANTKPRAELIGWSQVRILQFLKLDQV